MSPVTTSVEGRWVAMTRWMPAALASREKGNLLVNIAQPKDLLTTITLSGFILPAKAKS